MAQVLIDSGIDQKERGDSKPKRYAVLANNLASEIAKQSFVILYNVYGRNIPSHLLLQGSA